MEAQGHVDLGSWMFSEEEVMILNPTSGFIVSTEADAIYGLRRPESDFVTSVLHHLGIELVNPAPNSILILAIFQHLCEGFLGFVPVPSLFFLFLLSLSG